MYYVFVKLIWRSLKMSTRVLFVDDESVFIDQYSDLIKVLGMEVATALNGRLALESLANEKDQIDVVLLDLMMPGMTGAEVLREIRSDKKKYGNPKVVILSNLASEPMIKEAFGLGADSYLIKTEVTFDELKKEIEKVLSNDK